MIVAGSGGSEWSVFKRDQVACVDFTESMVDILSYSDETELPLKPRQRSYVWQFANDIKIGDYIVATSGSKKIFGIGQCVKNYYYDDRKPNFKHCIGVKWLKLDGNWYYQKKKAPQRTITKDSDEERIKLYRSILAGNRQISLNDFLNWYEENKEKLLPKAQRLKSENEKLREEFLQEWPLSRLASMTLDEYVIGKGAQNPSLCYQLEQGKYKNLYMSIRGGAATKFGIYWSKTKNDYLDKTNQTIPTDELGEQFEELKSDLLEIIEAGINYQFDHPIFHQKESQNSFFGRSAMIVKLLCIYDKGNSYFGVNNSNTHFWKQLLPLEIQGAIYKQNYQLVKTIQERYPELDGVTLGPILLQYYQLWEGDNETEMIEETMVSKYDKEIDMLKKSRNLIFRGAPGTGKTYLARQMAAEMIGCSVDELGEHPQFGFVQFHPNYDYSDFVEGLRPTTVGDSIGFELQDGIFKSFCKEAIAATEQGGQDNFDEAWLSFWETVSGETDSYKMKTLTGKPMNLIAFDRNGNTGVTEKSSSSLFFNYHQCYKVYRGFPGVPKGGLDNYRKAIIQEMKDKFGLKEYKAPVAQTAEGKPFIFLIDEINRGDMAKIFGELFFSLDPNYRGKTGAISTQYANLHVSEEKFYIPENVYIIGTMNDIDRSVDSFDFAMRRRFRFVEITAEDRLDMLEELGEQSAEAKIRLTNLNTAISNIEGLDSHYHIGPAYFLKLKEVDYDVLWSDFIGPLLEEYLRGNYNAAEELANLKEAFEDTTDYGN